MVHLFLYFHKMMIVLVFLSLSSIFFVSADSNLSVSQSHATLLKVGNLALATSQQPGPLVSFGQNIVDKNDLQLFAYVDYFNKSYAHFTRVVPAILYGITDRLSFFAQMPIATQFKVCKRVSAGLQDLILQFEYAVYDSDHATANNQVTIVSNVSLPTGSFSKNPPTGAGTPSFFVGATASSMGIDWYPFVSFGTTITPSGNNGTGQQGDQFLYQCGLGKNISYKANEWILTGVIELDGVYKEQNREFGNIGGNSRTHFILLGPSLWFSNQRFIIQAGISWIIFQNVAAVQPSNKYYIACDIGWKF